MATSVATPPRKARTPIAKRLPVSPHQLAWEGPITWLVAGALVVAIVVPVGYLVWESVTAHGPGTEITGTWYRQILDDTHIHEVLINTLILVVCSVGGATVIGVALAFITTRTNIPFPRSIGVVAFAPLLVPPFMLVVGWLMLASPRIGLFNIALAKVAIPIDLNIYTALGVVWVTALYLTPYIYVIAAAGFRSGSATQEEAARICGASPRRIFWRITARLNLPSISAAMMLALVLAAENFIIPTVLGGQAHFEVLSTAVWQNMNGYPAQSGLAAAEGFILTLFGLALLVGQRRTLARGSRATLSEKGLRSETWDLGRWRYVALLPIGLYGLFAVVLPVAAIVVVSFLRYWTTDLTAHNATVANYGYIFGKYPLLRSGLSHTLVLAVGGATLTVLLSLLLAWKANRAQGLLHHIIAYVSIIPLGIPGIAFGLAFLLAASDMAPVLYGTFWILLISYVVGYLPMGMQPVSAGIQQMGCDLEDSARLSGASWLRTLRSITFPLVRPSIAAGWILLYILLLRDISRTVLLYTPKTVTISIGLLDLQTEGDYPHLAAYSVVFLALGVVPLVLVQSFFGKSRGRR